ncbi:hypothetical protein [Rhizobium sp. WYJ-E13]|uniref:hypothetical protein n=1 Tax=Rhizobium sp. WYJ-E13 TaxID=2849093 RepID=UPI001C1EE89B|nr:hypothetical protein [Rhizobium sp. WYJ-E13]QWW67972.1 hypothetical protein KQ933_20700 [Rhizobium sp. WYJ-E13]
MKLVALIGSLSATSKKPFRFSDLSANSACLSRLSRENKRQAQKKLNKINAYRLVALIAPTEDALADKRRPPVVLGADVKNIKSQRNRTEAIDQPSADRLSDLKGLTFCGYLNANIFQNGVR